MYYQSQAPHDCLYHNEQGAANNCASAQDFICPLILEQGASYDGRTLRVEGYNDTGTVTATLFAKSANSSDWAWTNCQTLSSSYHNYWYLDLGMCYRYSANSDYYGLIVNLPAKGTYRPVIHGYYTF